MNFDSKHWVLTKTPWRIGRRGRYQWMNTPRNYHMDRLIKAIDRTLIANQKAQVSLTGLTKSLQTLGFTTAQFVRNIETLEAELGNSTQNEA